MLQEHMSENTHQVSLSDDNLQRVPQIICREIQRVEGHQSVCNMWRERLLIHWCIKPNRGYLFMSHSLERARQDKRHGEVGVSSQTYLKALYGEIWGFKYHCFAYSSTAGLFQELLSVMQDIRWIRRGYVMDIMMCINMSITLYDNCSYRTI